MKMLSYFFALAMLSQVAATEPVFKYAEWKTAAAVALPESLSGAQSTLFGNAGLKLLGSHFDARCYWTLPKTALESATHAESASAFTDLCDSPRYGAALFLLDNTMPLSVRAGKLSYARSLSQLKNPAPATTANPLTKTFSALYGLGAALPTLTSAEQPLSCALSIDFSPLTASVSAAAPVFEAALCNDSTACICIHGEKTLSTHTRALYSLTAARFFLESSSTLRAASADFESDWYNAALAEAAFLSPLLKANARAGCHQQPYPASGGSSSTALWLQLNVRAGWQCLLVDASFFAVPSADSAPKAAPVIGGSSSVCRTVRQASINPQTQWLLGSRKPLALRAGIHALWQERVTATKYADSYETKKLTAGASLESTQHALKATCAAVNVGITGAFHTQSSIPERYYQATLAYTLTKPSARAAVTLDAKQYPVQPLRTTSQEKRTYAVSANLSPGKARMLTVQAGASATYKADARTAGEINAAATIKLKTQKLRTTVKAALSLPF